MNVRSNPFPGLRPFNSTETHLFFGRDRVTDELLKRLRINRFLAVIGSSGCGKSSVVRAGVIPSLHGGYMTAAGSGWRVATMRPGAKPMANLAHALNEPDVLDPADAPDSTGRIFRETTLRRSRRGLVDAVLQADLPKGENVLVLVDQFEELFRFEQHRETAAARDEALAFVNRLLTAANQNEVPIYIVITMRSDFIGDCIRFPGLPAELNEGQYLVPRMTRRELRQAIEGPVAIGGGALAPRLTVRLLNEVGDDPDQLPVLQHALMRTWDAWERDTDGGEALDLRHYEAIGTMAQALSRHAEEAFHAPDCVARPALVESIFRSLTDADSEGRGVRRPTSVDALCQIADASLDDVCAVIECFRHPDTSFLMPPEPVPLTPTTVVDISHESLMRGWDRLQRWVRDEKQSARTYRRIAEAAAHYKAETGSLWRPPELDLGLQWRDNNHPTKAWALRYHPGFDAAMTFLDTSRDAWQQETAAREKARRRKFQLVSGAAVILLGFLAVASWFWYEAAVQRYNAETNLQTARDAINESLTQVADESLNDIPQMEDVRAKLLEKAQTFYDKLPAGKDANLILEAAQANRILGNVYTLQADSVKAKGSYDTALKDLTALVNRDPNNAEYQYELAATYNRYGEFERPKDSDAAEKAYRKAIRLQEQLEFADPDNPDYLHDLALSYNNLGVVLFNTGCADEAKQNYDHAITKFKRSREILKEDPAKAKAVYKTTIYDNAFRLAQTHNNLGTLLGAGGVDEYTRAIETLECAKAPDGSARQCKENLAKFYNNLGNLQKDQKVFKDAEKSNAIAVRLFEDLANPIPHINNELANAYNTLGVIMGELGDTEASLAAYQESIDILKTLRAATKDKNPSLDERLGNALTNLGVQIMTPAPEAPCKAVLPSPLYCDACGASEHMVSPLQEAVACDAVPLLQEAVECLSCAFESDAAPASVPQNLAKAWWNLAWGYRKTRNHKQAADAAMKITAKYEKGDESFFKAAADCLVEAAKLVDEQQQSEKFDGYKAKAVEKLKEAVDKGHKLKESTAEQEIERLLKSRPDQC